MKTKLFGFSLIELMTVITIMGILAAIAIPSYQNYTQRARFAEVIAATAPFKTAIALALQAGTTPAELANNTHGIPSTPAATKNLASLKVENGVVIATATNLAKNASYTLTPNADGSSWSIGGTCLKAGLCES